MFTVGTVGYQMQASPEAFAGSNIRIIEEEVSKRVDSHVSMLLQSAEVCKDEGVIYAFNISPYTAVSYQIYDCLTRYVDIVSYLPYF